MRVSFGTMQGNTFVFRSTSEALVDLNPMEAGVYDVVLYDTAQERSRLPKALTILPSPLPDTRVLLAGSFGNLTAERARSIVAGMPLTGVGQVVQVSEPLPESTRVVAGPVIEVPVKDAVRVPAIVEVGCHLQSQQGTPQCLVGDVVLQPTALMLVETPLGKLPFQVDQVRGTDPVETIEFVVDVTGRTDVLNSVRTGDVDHGLYFNPLAGGARVVELGPLKPSGDMGRIDLKLTAQAQKGAGGWIYGSAPLKVGLPFVLRTPRYEVQGTVVRVTPPWPGTTATVQ